MPESVLQRLLDAVETAVAAVVLEGEPSVRQGNLPEPKEEIGQLPVIVICSADDPEDQERFSAEADAAYKVTYKVDVVIIAAGGQEWVSQKAKVFRWRELVRGAFGAARPAGLASVTELIKCEVKPLEPLARRFTTTQFSFSGFTLKLACKEPQTVT